MSIRRILTTAAAITQIVVGEAFALEQAKAEMKVETPQAAVETLLVELRTARARVASRERDLARRERTIGDLEKEVLSRLKEVEELRFIVDQRIAAWEEAGADRIKRLSKIYAAMPPLKAASLLEELDASLATEILTKMKHKESAAVMTVISERRALLVSRQVAHPLSFEPAVPGDKEGS